MVDNLYVPGKERMLSLSMNYLHKMSVVVILAYLLTFPALPNNLHLPKYSMIHHIFLYLHVFHST